MELIFEQDYTVLPSVADASGRLGVAECFGVFMDVASRHAETLGLGLRAMARRDLFWLTVKSRIRFYERPRMMERVTLRTWPEAPGKVRGTRSYQILRDGQPLIAGKTEWAVVNTKTGQFTPLADIYPAALDYDAPPACPEPFARIPESPADWEPFAEYRVRSTDIDVGGHMNNAAYVRALLGGMSSAELRALRIGQADVIFRSPCYEGEALTFQRRARDGGLDLRIVKADGAAALLSRIESK